MAIIIIIVIFIIIDASIVYGVPTYCALGPLFFLYSNEMWDLLENRTFVYPDDFTLSLLLVAS